MTLLGPNGLPLPDAPTVARIPSYDEMVKFLDTVTGITIMFLKQRQADPLTLHSIGVILSKLTWDNTQTQAEIQHIISKAATDQLEKLKLELINASVAPDAPPSSGGTA